MKQTINFNNFVDAFHSKDRGEQFSYDALKAIFEYIEDYERDAGEETELDVIAICCEFSEMSEDEFRNSYTIYDDETIEDYIEYNGCWYAKLDNGNYVFLQF